MSGVVRESWVLVGFVALALAALTVSVAGWILFARDRRERRSVRPSGQGESESAPS